MAKTNKNDGSVIKAATKSEAEKLSSATVDKDGARIFKLEDSRVVKIIKGKGWHVEETLRIINGDSSKYMSALMAQLITVDGKSVLMEDIREFDMKDYTLIMTEFTLSGNL